MGRPRKQKREPFWRSERNCWYVHVKGKQHRLARDKDEAWRLYHELMARPPEEKRVESAPTQIAAEIIDLFLDWASKNRAPRTYGACKEQVQKFVDSLPDGITISEIRPYHVTRVMDADSSARGNNTKNDFATTVQRAFNWAEKQGLIANTPTRHVEKPGREAREMAVSPEQCKSIIGAVRERNFRGLMMDSGVVRRLSVPGGATGGVPRVVLNSCPGQHLGARVEHDPWPPGIILLVTTPESIMSQMDLKSGNPEEIMR